LPSATLSDSSIQEQLHFVGALEWSSAQTVGFHCPHQTDVGSCWRPKKRRWPKNSLMKIIFRFKLGHGIDFALVFAIRTQCPAMNHVEDPHTFKTEQLPI
jgi:hypothetical protein